MKNIKENKTKFNLLEIIEWVIKNQNQVQCHLIILFISQKTLQMLIVLLIEIINQTIIEKNIINSAKFLEKFYSLLQFSQFLHVVGEEEN